MSSAEPRRALPAVGTLLGLPAVRALAGEESQAIVADAARAAIALVRDGTGAWPADLPGWVPLVEAALVALERPSLRRVLNGTGVVLHTNLGRAPLADEAMEAVAQVAAGYSNLEYDTDSGARGSRYVHCAALLRALTGAEDAIVVNNGAAALTLVLNTVAEGRGCAISRGELVEIGGSFRIPDVMAKSGARLMEVGTTNRTHLPDYAAALDRGAAAIARVHRSNFAIAGFVAGVEAGALAALARERDVPLVHDLGSGLLLDLGDIGLRGEPTVADAVADGPALVTMSGDKLLGGPQAGIIVGARRWIDAVRRNPLTRSYRVDKLTIAALEATLALYRRPARARVAIPVLFQLSQSVEALRARGQRLLAAIALPEAALVDSEASVGGGAFPTARIASAAITLPGSPARVDAALRAGTPAVIGRVIDGRLSIDLRTVLPRDEDSLIRALRALQ